MEKRIIPTKNYIILAVLVLVTVILTFYFVSWYETSREYQRKNSVIADVLAEIRIEEIDNYLLDNPNVVIYISSSTNENIKAFENKFKKLILKNEISEEMVYLNTNNVMDNNYQVLEKRFDDSLKNRNITLANSTNLLVIREGKVIDTLYKDNQIINEVDVNQFLETYEVLE